MAIVFERQKVIYKLTLENNTYQSVRSPEIIDVLDVQVQNGSITVWAMVKKDTSLMNYLFTILGTGQPLPLETNIGSYVGTVQLEEFAWHVFYYQG